MANNLPPPHSPGSITFVQADPSNFRAIVQHLTGAAPPHHPPPPSSSAEAPPKRPPFNLHERRQKARKLEIQLGGFGSGSDLGSPVSPFDLFARGSSHAPLLSPVEEEDRAIARKGFYLHPSPLNTPRGPDPELLPLFPVDSPRVDPASSSS